MTDSHGVAIVCEREGGHTVAWVDDARSKHVPVGYFIESWFVGKHHVVRAGLLDGGYFSGWDEAWEMNWYAEWRSFDKALAWCQYDARQRQRQIHNQLITYGLLGAMVNERKEQGA